jgi:hypothetical protein
MALAIKFQVMVDSGKVRDYADLARLGYVTRARLTQIMNLLLLAPDIQEHLLFAGSCNSAVASSGEAATYRGLCCGLVNAEKIVTGTSKSCWEIRSAVVASI